MIGFAAGGILAVAMLATQACSDSTGPSPAIELRVPQETLREPAPGTINLQWVAHNRSNGPVNVGLCSTTLEQEVGPDSWTTARVLDALCAGLDVAPGQDLAYSVSFTGLEAGRYRITVPWGIRGASGQSLAYSNVFVVT
jgi:hypothetical protein